MSKYTGNAVVSGINQNDTVESLIVFHDVKDLKTDKNDIVAGIYYEAVVPARRINFFHQIMADYFIKLEPNNQKYQLNGAVRKENFKVKLLFPMKEFV